MFLFLLLCANDSIVTDVFHYFDCAMKNGLNIIFFKVWRS